MTDANAIDLRNVRWPDGYTGLTVPHGSVFARHCSEALTQ